MEHNLDIANQAIHEFENALDNFMKVQKNIKELEEYYHSSEWLKDYDADNRGEIPPCVKRGVLSEDAVYSLLRNNDILLNKFK